MHTNKEYEVRTNNNIDSTTSKQVFYKPIICKINNVKIKPLNRCHDSIFYTCLISLRIWVFN